jgi:hypothetical protein
MSTKNHGVRIVNKLTCTLPIFPQRGGLIPIGHCGLEVNHSGVCRIIDEAKSVHERTITHELDVDLSEAWKPIRDLPDGELPAGIIGDEI